MGKIIIGQEYEREFASICALFEGGFLSSDIHIKKAHGNVIITPSHTFEYREKEHGVNGGGDGGERALTFTKDGASWFSALRGESFDSGNADWKQLIMDVAQDYHRHYSLIEFRQTKDRSTLAGEKKLKEQFKTAFLDRVFTDGKAFTVAETRKTEPENFYAVSMRLEINGGGESAPLLGKIYFREGDDGKLVPVTNREARKIDGYIENAVPADDDADDRGTLEVALVGRVFGGLEKSFKSGNFAKYVSFNDKYRAEIKEMLDQLATSEVKSLECTNVKVLGISHVEWEKSVYNISYRGKTVLRFIAGLNGYVSLQCANCAEGSLLIDGNSVKSKDGSTLAELDFDKPDLGLTETDIQNIRENGEAANHLFTVSCPENPRNRDCSRVICASLAVTVDDGVMKCKGCRYPEIIYADIFSYGKQEGKYTPALHFASDRLSLIDAPTTACRCCGREFTNSNILRGELCGFCASDDKSPKAKKLYRRYGGMLDLTIRVKHLFSKKYCREEGNIILFELGNDRYVFDKLNIREFGFIKKPQKVKKGDKK